MNKIQFGTPIGPVTWKREAVRAIIMKDDKILMIRSERFKELKFPGGGIIPGETDEIALKREVLEETGYAIDQMAPSPRFSTIEYRKRLKKPNECVEMISRYYQAEAHQVSLTLDLDPYEKSFDYHPVWIKINQAILENEKQLKAMNEDELNVIPWIKRELSILRRIQASTDH